MKPSITNAVYYVSLITKKGTVKYDITNVLLSLKISDSENELATAVNLSFVNAWIESANSHLTGLFTVGDVIQVQADTGDGKKTVGTFTVWDRSYESALKKVLTVTAYDSKLIYLQKSEDVRLYTKGKDTKTIISDICKAWGVPLEYKYSTTTHKLKQWRGTKLSEMILECLEDVRKKTGTKYVLYSDNGKLVISSRGQNQTVYEFKGKENVLTTASNITLEGVVTKVIIHSNSEEGVRSKLEATVTGNTAYGTLQSVIVRSDNTALSECKKEAEQAIKDAGKPFQTFVVNAKDIPWIKKGDKVKVVAGDMSGDYYVTSIVHEATDGTMSMEVER